MWSFSFNQCVIFRTTCSETVGGAVNCSSFDYHLALITEEERDTLGDVMPAKSHVLVMKAFIIDL